ncbi:MAG: PEGA domain-containing protein [Planctomycetota bacterium]|jgi:hypothetical protein
MGNGMRVFAVVLMVSVLLAGSGCVERKLTIVTEPSDAVVWLNDEEVGTTPVTVNFNWYGDYSVRVEKPGYEILNTHRKLERPAHDRFPLDFFAEISPKHTIDEYTWEFELEKFQQMPPNELVQQAHKMRNQANDELGKVAVEILDEEEMQ